MIHELDKIHVSHFFIKIPFQGKWEICVQFGRKLWHFISRDLLNSKDFLEISKHIGVQQLEGSIGDFFSEISFSSKTKTWAQFGPKLFSLISHELSLIFFETFQDDGTRQFEEAIVGQFFPEFLFQCKKTISAQVEQKLSNLMTQEIVFHDFLSASFEILQYDGRQ